MFFKLSRKSFIAFFLITSAFADLSYGASIAHKNGFSSFCIEIEQDEARFNTFRRAPEFGEILGNISKDLGAIYLDVIKQSDPDLLNHLDRIRELDSLGNPHVENFEEHGWVSPSIFRYIKIAADLKKEFDSLSSMHIVEIGGGFGALAKVLHETAGFASYTIVNTPENNALTKKFLDKLGMTHVHFIDAHQLSKLKSYDLVISNYHFSEFSQKQQMDFIHSIFQKTPNGYLTLNYISHFFGIKSLTLEELVKQLRSPGRVGKIVNEYPLTDENNKLMVWKSYVNGNTSQKNDQVLQKVAEGNGCAITYGLSGGRLGDNLLAYLHAKWISYKYGLPLLNISFPMAENFLLDDIEQKMVDGLNFDNQVIIKEEQDIVIDQKTTSTLFTLPYFPESRFEVEMLNLHHLPFINVDWEDPIFKAEIKKVLAPKQPVHTANLPKNVITVGVHVRRGGGIDSPEAAFTWPLKFPPDSYYIEQIDKIAKLFPKEMLYVYILTDDPKPAKIAKNYAKTLKNKRLIFNCRKTKNGPKINILEDFYLIPQFNCVILCDSNFGTVASKLGNYKVKISPKAAVIKDGIIKITDTDFVWSNL